MVVLEALAHALPVVVSNARYCGIAQWLTHGTHALVLQDPRSAEELAAAVRRLQDDEDLCRHLADRGRALASQHSWQAVAEGQARVYGRAAAPVAGG